MDALLALILALLVFVVLIILIRRSVWTIVLIGFAVVAFLVLRAFGLLGGRL